MSKNKTFSNLKKLFDNQEVRTLSSATFTIVFLSILFAIIISPNGYYFINTSSSDYHTDKVLFSEARTILEKPCYRCSNYSLKISGLSKDIKLVRITPVMRSSSKKEHINVTQQDIDKGTVFLENHIAIVSFNDGKPDLTFKLPEAELFPIIFFNDKTYKEIREAQDKKYARYIDIKTNLNLASNIFINSVPDGVVISSSEAITSVPMQTIKNLLSTINDKVLEKTPYLIKEQENLRLWQDAKS